MKPQTYAVTDASEWVERKKIAAAAQSENRAAEFKKVLNDVRRMREADMCRAHRLAAEDKIAQERKGRKRRISELRALIGQLRQKLVTSGFSPKIAAQLSVAQNELFWLLLGF